MAQRGEGQGLQIAVISFAMLTIILAITTYVFYAQSQTAHKDLETAKNNARQQQEQNDKLLGRVAAMKYVLGLGGMTKEDVNVAKAKVGDDPEIKEILDNFESDIALLGEQAAPQGTQSYRTYTTALLAALNKKNASVSDAIDQSRKAQQDKDAAELAAKGRAEAAEASQSKAAADYKAESEKFAADRVTSEEQNSKLNATIAAITSKGKNDLQKVIEEKEVFAKNSTQLRDTVNRLTERVKEAEKEKASLFENPDGRIKLVNQRQRLVWIDVGRADGLIRQTTFSVYDHDENGVSTAKPKARVEVVSLGDRLSEARILEDSPANPIINGDVIHTPTWSPGQRIHFALALKMDINKDGTDDYDMVKSIIQMNGGVIDAELRPDGTRGSGNITVNTRYFVQGERISETTNEKVREQYNAFDQEREKFGVEKINVEKLLNLMGWKAEERVVELSGSRAGGDFRKRTPGKTQPAGSAKSSESAAPASDTPAAPAPANVDPFAPSGATPPSAPAAADPFAPAADPFAPR
jgi:hypothetical protein